MAHLYWRVFILGNAGQAAYSDIAEIEMCVGMSGTTQTSGGTAIASGSFNGSFLPANAFDGNPSTSWATPNGSPLNQWCGYQFASAVDVTMCAITARNDNNDASWPMYFNLDFSDDGTTWTTAFTFGAATLAEAVRLRFMLFAPDQWKPDTGFGVVNLSPDARTLTASANNSGTTSQGIRSGGKVYFEILPITSIGFAQSCGLYDGLGGFTVDYLGAVTLPNGAGGVGTGAMVAGTAMCFAWDDVAKLGWIRSGSGTWNGSGTADPATGTGGQDLSGAKAFHFPPGLTGFFSTYIGQGYTMLTRPADFLQTPPAGFSPWDAGAAPAAGGGGIFVSG